MSLIIWENFTEEWLKRSKRKQECVDDADRFISLWIAFNGWMKGRFGEPVKDSTLIKRVKEFEDIIDVFNNLKTNDQDFAKNLDEIGKYSVLDMRHTDDRDRQKRYDGTFESLIEVIYQVRCNLFHGRKGTRENEKDLELIRLSHNILLPLFEEYLNRYEHR